MRRGGDNYRAHNTVAPIQYSAKGYPIIQWEKDGAEEMGLVKIDLLETVACSYQGCYCKYKVRRY